MFFGGWLYPEVVSLGVAGAVATFNAPFKAVSDGLCKKDNCDCAAMGAHVEQATTAPAKRSFKAFWTGINFLRFNPSAKLIENTILRWRWAAPKSALSLSVAFWTTLRRRNPSDSREQIAHK
jgi:hypothetical protein